MASGRRRRRRPEDTARITNERRLEELFLQSPEAVVITRGPDHVIDFANPAFFRALGTRDCFGKSARQAFPEAEGQGYADLLDYVFVSGRSYSATEAPLLIDRKGNGEVEEAFFNFVYQPMLDGQGRVEGVLGHGVEVTDMVLARRQVEAMAAEVSERYERELGVTELLQRSFLPERLPTVPGIALAGRYVAGSAEADVGGDWYDALVLPDGALVLVIGDVEGHGLRSATSMSQLRNAMRAYLVEDSSPASALGRLRRLAEATGEECLATVLCVSVGPGTTSARFASAGHLPPLLLSADGSFRYLTSAGTAPIGAPVETPVPEATFALEPGSTLLLYTDGLVERRDADLDAGLARLSSVAAAAAPADVDGLVDRLLDEVADDRSDDVALLALRVQEAASGG